MAQIVNLPNGDTAQFPDAMPKEQIETVLQQHFSAPPKDTSGGLQDLNVVGPAVYGVLTGVPGGKAAAAGLRGLTNDKPYKQNRADIEAEATHAFKRGPVSAAISGAATLAEGGALTAGVPGVATKLVQGERAANLGRLAATGAKTGAVYSAADAVPEETAKVIAGDESAPEALKNVVVQTGEGAAVGAVAGPAAGVVGHVAAPAIRAVGRGAQAVAERAGVAGPDANAVPPAYRILARQLKTSVSDIKTFSDQFAQDAGRRPRLAEIISARDAGELSAVGRQHGAAGEALQDAEAQIAGARTATMPAQIAKGGPSPTLSEVALVRDASNDAAMAPIRDSRVNVSPGEADILAGQRVRSVLAGDPALRTRIAQVASGEIDSNTGQAASLSVGDFEQLRQALRSRQGSLKNSNPALSKAYGNLAEQVSNIATAKVPEYRTALDTFAANARRLEGTKTGVAGKDTADLTSTPKLKTLATPEGVAGQQQGARRRLIDAASSSETGAVTLANKLRQPSALANEAPSLGAPERDSLQRLGAAETQSAERMATLAPRRLSTPGEESSQQTRGLIENVAAVGGHVLTGFKVHVVERLLTQTHMNEKTALKVVDALTDPSRVGQAIDALHRARLNDQQVRDIVLRAAHYAGAAGGGVAGGVR